MGSLHFPDHSPGWINRRFAKLERQIRELAAARRLENAVIGAGGLHVRGGDVFLEDRDGRVRWKASEDPTKLVGAWNSANGLSIPSTWTVLGHATAVAPIGFVGQAHVTAMVSCGDTMSTGTGSVSVQPTFRYVFTDGSTSGWAAASDTAIASPNTQIAVASSFWSYTFPMAEVAGHAGKVVKAIEVGANCVLSFGAETGTDGNWHVAMSVVFKRGGEL